ncbi:MAG: DUF6518 family protein [Ilumatobacteraceae bacterium]
MRTEMAAEPGASTRSGCGDDPLRRGWVQLLVTAAVVGSLFGALDLAGQVHTPYPYANLFNSPAVWAAVAFFIGRWATRVARAAPCAVVGLVLGVESYYAADVIFRGANTSNLWSSVAAAWFVLAVGAGLVFGAAGASSTHVRPWTAALASATLPAVVLAEAAHEATTSRETTWMALLVVIAAIITAWLLRRADRATVGRTVLCIAGWTALGFIASLPFG